MRIVEWNCQGAFRKKNEKVIALKPDIIIVPECENADKLQFGKLTPQPNDFFWYGDSPNKGIGIFSYSDYHFEIHKSFNPKFRYVIPLIVKREREYFVMFAIWAMNNEKNHFISYIGQVWLAINYYSKLMSENTILIGDFNSNQIWDSKDRVGNHTDVVNFLKLHGIYSLYHICNSLCHGQEKDGTFYMYRNKNKSYHIDYCFVAEKILECKYNFTLGQVDDWIAYSDHVPIIADIFNKLNYARYDNSLELFLYNKLSDLQVQTKDKFSKEINNIMIKAQKSDNLDNTAEHLQERFEIIKDCERLLNIDDLIKSMYIDDASHIN